MCDSVDAFLEDILSLPRWVNRALILLRELDKKSQECGEEAQRRRERYLDMARAKLQALGTQPVPDGFYADVELEAEAAAAADRGREAHALMKEKVMVLNQLLRVLRGETESFKLSLAKFAKEVGGEEMLRQSRRKPEGSSVPCSDRTDDTGQCLAPPAMTAAPHLSARAPHVRGRVGLSVGVTDGSARGEHNLGLLGTSEDHGRSDAVCSVPLGVPSTGSSTNRNRPSKKSVVRSSSSAATSGADCKSHAKRARPSAPGIPAKKSQGKEAVMYGGIDDDCIMQMPPTGDGSIGGAPVIHVGPACSGSTSAPQHGPLDGRAKRSKQASDVLHGPHSSSSLLPPLSTTEMYGDQSNGGRPTRGNLTRIKKSRDQLPDESISGIHEVAGAPTDVGHFEPLMAEGEGLDGGNMPPTGIPIGLPSTVQLQQQQHSTSKTRALAERPNNKPTPRSLAGRVAIPRPGPG